jgi:tRNA pseudouridine55 synthase
MPVAVALCDLTEVALGVSDAARIGRGQPVLLRGGGAPLSAAAAYASHAGRAIALGEIAQGQFHPTRVFRPD